MKNCLRYPIFNQLKNWGAKLRINILTAKSFLLIATDSQIMEVLIETMIPV
jgi:hypothetical protein